MMRVKQNLDHDVVEFGCGCVVLINEDSVVHVERSCRAMLGIDIDTTEVCRVTDKPKGVIVEGGIMPGQQGWYWWLSHITEMNTSDYDFFFRVE